MSYFGTIFDSQPDDLDDDGIVSPNGRYLVKVTHRGVLPQGVTEGTIWIFDTAAVRQRVNVPKSDMPKPDALVRMSAAVNGIEFVQERGNTIARLKWADNSDSLTFLGRDGSENWRLYRVALNTRAVTALTPATQNVLDYASVGDSLAYLAAAGRRDDQLWSSTGPGIRDIEAGTGTPLIQLLYPHWNGDEWCLPVTAEVWKIHNDSAAPVIDPTTAAPLRITTRYLTETLAMSADAQRLALIAYQTVLEGPVGRDQLPKLDRDLQYRIVDLDRGTVDSLLGAPIVDFDFEQPRADRYRAAWSPRGDEVAVSETHAAPDSAGASGSGDKKCTVAVIRLATRQSQCIVIPDSPAIGFLYSLQWLPSDAGIRLRYRHHGESIYVDKLAHRTGKQWNVDVRPLPPAGLPLELTVQESLNQPPALVATDPRTKKSRLIFDPNPQLADINLGSVSVYTWKDSNGRTVQGGLVRPPEYKEGTQYPLVIQTHGFNSHQFFTSGYAQTANAGRPLAGRGIIVLQVREPSEPFAGTWQAATENGMKVHLAAVDQLAAEGLIDPARVGIVGYSARGLGIARSITQAPDRFSAVALANTDPGSLFDYLTYIDYVGEYYAKLAANVTAGAKPYGAGLQDWIDRAPGFSTAKIEAPVLVMASDPFHLMNLWSLYASLRDQKKPVELQYIRSGMHNIMKPAQRFAHQEMLVDWFDFWLNGHEDPDATKRDQYVRWRVLRELKLNAAATYEKQ